MLKWTASVHRTLPQATSPLASKGIASRHRKKRATIANKENLVVTSTPLQSNTSTQKPSRPLTPLMDILKATFEPRTPNSTTVTTNCNSSNAKLQPPRNTPYGVYASTLPHFEEEYSPTTVLPTGQQLAMRGLLPDPFLGQPRYFATPELIKKPEVTNTMESRKSLPQRRKLQQEFEEIAATTNSRHVCKTPKSHTVGNDTAPMSSKMDDQTLDRLIDAILESARKENKKEKRRKSLNLRRRTLLKNQANSVQEITLSPSYAAGDDPASDLNVSQIVAPVYHVNNAKDSADIVGSLPRKSLPGLSLPSTPSTSSTRMSLQHMPTPASVTGDTPTMNGPRKNDSFMLDTPVHRLTNKRHRTRTPTAETSKRFKDNTSKYFEIGLALPSIHV